MVLRYLPPGVVLALLAACTPGPPARQPFADVEITEENLEQFARSCVICHAPGYGGAPRPGDSEAWLPRLARGMPPLGMCHDCSTRDLQALIRLLTEGVATPFQFWDLPYHAYFKRIEQVFLKYDGRPHWGKLYTLAADDFDRAYLRWQDFLDVRETLDPGGRLLNPHLRRVFGVT